MSKKAQLVDLNDPKHNETLANILLEGGVVGAIWGHHLYFLACNGYNSSAVKRMNLIKGRPANKVFASPGAVKEAEEFADLEKSKALIYASKKMGVKPLEYLEFLYKKFPLAVELFANSKAPATVTFATKEGKTIWLAGHLNDKKYTQLLDTIRSLRHEGKKIIFAGTSLNLAGDDTLTVREFDKVINDFGDKVDGLSVYPKADRLKKLRYSTSSSAISFTGSRPKLLRVGVTPIFYLSKYIPDLQIPEDIKNTRKH